MLFLYGTEIFLSFAVRVFSRVGYKSNLYKKEGEGSVGIDVDGFGSDIFYGEDIICIFVIVIVKCAQCRKYFYHIYCGIK